MHMRSTNRTKLINESTMTSTCIFVRPWFARFLG